MKQRRSLEKQFNTLIGGGKGVQPQDIGPRVEKVPTGPTLPMRTELAQDKGPVTRTQHKRHLGNDFMHHDIGVQRSKRGNLDLKELSQEHAKALRAALKARKHGQRDEVQKAIKKITASRSSAGLHRLAQKEGMVGELIHRIFGSQPNVATERDMPTGGSDPQHRSKAVDPVPRMEFMVERALAGLNLHEHLMQD